MIPRLLILIALLSAGLAGGVAESWGQEMPGHGLCGMAGEGGAPTCGEGADDPAADAAAAPCAMTAACAGWPAVAAAAGLAPHLAPIARPGPIGSDRLPAGRASKPSLEPPIVRS